MLHIKDQNHDLVVADFVQDPPVAGTYSPGPRIPDKLCGLSWPGIVRKPVNHASHLLADRAVKPLECFTRLVAEDNLINHWLQASFRLDLIPRDKRLARFDAGTGLTGRSSIGEILQQLGQFAWRQPLQLSGNGGGNDRGDPFTVFGDVHDLATCGLMSGRCHAWRGLDR
jgi:hypothetical protein